MSKPILTLPCKHSLSDFEQRGDLHHCQSCDHSLKDFRNATDAEIREAITAATGNTCGIFNPDQVTAKSSTFYLGLQRRVGLSLLGILGFVSPMVMTSCTSTPPTDPHTGTKEENAFSKLKFPMYLKGTLMDQATQTPIINARIRILQQDKTLLSGHTDNNGRFAITVHEGDLSNAHFDLILDKMGYVNDTIRDLDATKQKSNIPLKLTLEARNEDQNVVCKPGEVAIEQPLVGDISAPMPIEPLPVVPTTGKIAAPDPVTPPSQN